MNDAALETLAHNVRLARVSAGLSLDALAARAEVSKGALVALEGARGNPNFATLVRLADALGRSVSSLTEQARNDAALIVVDVAAVEPLWTGSAGGTARLLLTNPRPAPVEVWRWVLHPAEQYDSQPHAPGTTETITVIRGQMALTVGETSRSLPSGATSVFVADVPHAYAGAGRGPCELVMTVHLPSEHRA